MDGVGTVRMKVMNLKMMKASDGEGLVRVDDDYTRMMGIVIYDDELRKSWSNGGR